MHPGDQCTEHVGRIMHRTPKHARVQIRLRAIHPQFEIRHPAQTVNNRGIVGQSDAGISIHAKVGCQQFAVLFDESGQIGRTHFLFALNHHLDVHRQPAPGTRPSLQRGEHGRNLAFVIGCAPGVQIIPARRRLERGRFPLVNRVSGLHIVMPINENGWLTVRAKILAIDDRVPAGGHHANRLQANGAHSVRHPRRRSLHVGFMIRKRGDAGNGAQVDYALQRLLLMSTDEVSGGLDCGH